MFVDLKHYGDAQAVLRGHNRPKHSKRDLAFRGLVHCAYDGCLVTGEIQKQKYIYYRCTGHRGKCALPRFREEELATRLGEPLMRIQVPEEVASGIVKALEADRLHAASKASEEQVRLQRRIAAVQSRIDAAYIDKLDGKISEQFWERKRADWQAEEQQVRIAMLGVKQAEGSDCAVDAARIFELAKKAHSLYLLQDSSGKAELLRMVFSNCSVDAVSVTPTYRKPFDLIFKRAKKEEWSGRLDSNQRPHPPQGCALPG